jgi:hypothetical protein
MNTDDNWIFFSQSKKGDTLKMYSINGLVISKQSVYIQLDWSKIKEDKEGYILVKSGESIMKINIKAKKFDLSEIEPKTYLMTHNYVTIDVARYSKVVDGKGVDNKGDEVENKFIIIPDNGKYLSALRTTSSTITYENVEDLKNAPYAEYTVYVSEDDTYTLQSQFNPTSNLVYGKVRLRYGISIDDGDIEIINSIKGDYLAGTWKQGTWTVDIEKNSRISLKEKISLKKGVHTIKYYQCDPNIALIRMVLYKGKLGNVYGSPEESPYVL